MSILIRQAVTGDAQAIATIYNQAIEARIATFETELRTTEERENWIADHDARHPILVAEEDKRVIGWASVSPYRSRQCYDGIGDFSVYIHKELRGKGIGKELLTKLIDECTVLGYWKLLSRIFDFNHSSRALCKSCGFREVGIYEKHGNLDGRWLDCVIVEKIITQNLSVLIP